MPAGWGEKIKKCSNSVLDFPKFEKDFSDKCYNKVSCNLELTNYRLDTASEDILDECLTGTITTQSKTPGRVFFQYSCIQGNDALA